MFLMFFAFACAVQRVDASSPDFTAWVEMTSLCEDVISMNSDDHLSGFPKGPPILALDGVVQTSVSHPEANLNLSTLHNGENWFLCVVGSNDALTAPELGQIIAKWTIHQLDLVRAGEGKALLIDNDLTFAPARVICRHADQVTLVMAYLDAETKEFRVGVLGRLPKQSDNPCSKEAK
ncbi:hypothetical protein [uncultured Tateyamaria sp.]|uniref:hypothetical protein n=1 Tax=uncultured Tateyamaria sp. TaxID=455651 RepID=UPI00261CFBD0|nr:hypothetical protein [uncultured Tateyamaria sp.]